MVLGQRWRTQAFALLSADPLPEPVCHTHTHTHTHTRTCTQISELCEPCMNSEALYLGGVACTPQQGGYTTGGHKPTRELGVGAENRNQSRACCCDSMAG